MYVLNEAGLYSDPLTLETGKNMEMGIHIVIVSLLKVNFYMYFKSRPAEPRFILF